MGGMPEAPSLPIPRTALPEDVLRTALAALSAGQRVVVATVIARHGSAPSTPGQKLALLAGPPLVALGTIGGGAVERVVMTAMQPALEGAVIPPRVETFRLGASLGMCCGGSVEILIEPLLPAMHALVVGAGHVGVFVAPLLASLGFRVTLADARVDAADPARVRAADGLEPGGAVNDEPGSVRVVHADHDDPEVLAGLPADLGGSVFLVMTHDHQVDQEAIAWALGRGFGFVGGVGSRAKAARTRARLESRGFPPDDVRRVRMPVGVDVAARTPPEIGVAIAAELVAWRAARLGAARARPAEGAGATAHAGSTPPETELRRTVDGPSSAEHDA
jgi:xanthine dehydrogenase accessory factor